MNILYINTYYKGGGAEKVVRQLYRGISSDDIHTYCIVGRYQMDVPEDVEVIYSSFLERAETTARGGLLRNTLFHTPKARDVIIRCIQEKHIDIVHFHNMHSNYLGLQDIEEIHRYCPNIIITLHDMWAMTGGCAYSFECMRWQTKACRECRGNEGMKPFSMAHYVYAQKVQALAGKGYQYVVPSRWLQEYCHYGVMKEESVRLICNGISMDRFQPRDKAAMKKKYQLPIDKHVLLFAANGTDNVYKGFPYLLEALQMLPDKEQYVLAVVGNKGKLSLDIAFEVHAFGYISSEEELNELYSAADLFLLPSVADVSSFTAMESMASGTPVLSFATGGIPEIVTDEVGWTVEPRDSSAMARKIADIFAPESADGYCRRQLACPTRIDMHYNDDVMLQNYKELYNEMMHIQR